MRRLDPLLLPSTIIDPSVLIFIHNLTSRSADSPIVPPSRMAGKKKILTKP